MRTSRKMNEATRAKISESLKGRTFSDTHKQAISEAMKAYWQTIPNEEKEVKNEER